MGGNPTTGAPRVRSNQTLCQVTFFTHARTNNRLPAYRTNLGNETSSLVSWSFTKRLGEAAGQVTIELKPYKESAVPVGTQGAPWISLLNQGDWWAIDVVKNGVPQGLSFGVIDEVKLDLEAGERGQGRGLVTITGRDFGFALQDTPLFFNPHDPAIDNALGINMQAILDTIAGKCSDVVVNMITGLMGRGTAAILGGHIEVPRGLAQPSDEPDAYWVDQLDTSTCVQPNLRGEVFAASALSPEGAPSLWDFIDAWRNPVMNELFIDTVPSPGFPKQARLVLREKPFINTVDTISPWERMICWSIEASMLMGMSISKGLHRKNHIQLTGDMLPAMGNHAYGLYLPKADLDSIRRYGLKRLEENTRYYDETGESGFQNDQLDWLNLIISWNVLNHEYYMGQLSLGEMRAEIRIGQKVAIAHGPPAGYAGLPSGGAPRPPTFPPDPGALTFYVEGVQHVWRAGERPTAKTTLMVSRGYVESERLGGVRVGVSRFEIPAGEGTANGRRIDVSTDDEVNALDTTGYGGAHADEDYSVPTS